MSGASVVLLVLFIAFSLAVCVGLAVAVLRTPRSATTRDRGARSDTAGSSGFESWFPFMMWSHGASGSNEPPHADASHADGGAADGSPDSPPIDGGSSDGGFSDGGFSDGGAGSSGGCD